MTNNMDNWFVNPVFKGVNIGQVIWNLDYVEMGDICIALKSVLALWK